MAEIKLNIYKEGNKKEVEKTYEADTYELMLGTVEDLMAIIDVDKMNDKMEITKMVMSGFNQLKPLIKDIFAGITDEELKRVKVKELIPMFYAVGVSIVEDLDLVKSGN